MTDQEKRMESAQKIILTVMKKTAAVLDAIPDEGRFDRLGVLDEGSQIMLRLSEAMKNVSM